MGDRVFLISTIFAALLWTNVLGQMALLMPKPDDGKPPPNPFGDTDPPAMTETKIRPTPPPLELPNQVFGAGPAAPVLPPQSQPGAPQPFNPPTPPPLPTPPPIGGAPSGLDKGNSPPQGPKQPQQSQPPSNPNNPFDKLSSVDQPAPAPAPARAPPATPAPAKGPPKWTKSRSQDDGVHLSGAGWPRLPRSVSTAQLWSLMLRHKRQADLAKAAAAASAAGQASKTADAASQAAKGAAGAAKAPNAGSLPGAGNVPDASNIPKAPGANNIPDAGSKIPSTDSLPSPGGDSSSGGSPSSSSGDSSPPSSGGGGAPSISTFPDTNGDIVMPANPNKPTTPRFMLPRHLDAIKANPEALEQLKAFG